MRKPRGDAPNAHVDKIRNQKRFKAKKKVTFDLRPQICVSPLHRNQDLFTIRTPHTKNAGLQKNANSSQTAEDVDGRRVACSINPTRAHSSDTEVYHVKNKARVVANTLKLRPKKGCLKKRQESSSLTTLSPISTHSHISLFSPSVPPKLTSVSETATSCYKACHVVDSLQAPNVLESDGNVVNSWTEQLGGQENFDLIEEQFATMRISNKMATQITNPSGPTLRSDRAPILCNECMAENRSTPIMCNDCMAESKSWPWSISIGDYKKIW